MEFLRSELMFLSKDDILAKELKRIYVVSIWGSFRTYLREIYMPEITLNSDIRAKLAREKREKNKGEVIGHNDTGKNSGRLC